MASAFSQGLLGALQAYGQGRLQEIGQEEAAQREEQQYLREQERADQKRRMDRDELIQRMQQEAEFRRGNMGADAKARALAEAEVSAMPETMSMRERAKAERLAEQIEADKRELDMFAKKEALRIREPRQGRAPSEAEMLYGLIGRAVDGDERAGKMLSMLGVAKGRTEKQSLDDQQRQKNAEIDDARALLSRIQSGPRDEYEAYKMSNEKEFSRLLATARQRKSGGDPQADAFYGTAKPAKAEKSQAPTAQPKTRRLSVGIIDDGYRYKGGDPSKASSWEKI